MTKIYATTGTVRTHLIRTVTLTSRIPRTWCLRDMPPGCGLAEYDDTTPADMCPSCTNAYTESLDAREEVARARAVLAATAPSKATRRRTLGTNP